MCDSSLLAKKTKQNMTSVSSSDDELVLDLLTQQKEEIQKCNILPRVALDPSCTFMTANQ